MCYFMKKRLTAFALMLCMAFTSVAAFALEGETGTGVPGTEAPGTEVPGTEVPEVPGHPESLDPPGYPGYPDYPGHLGLPALVFTESHRAP